MTNKDNQSNKRYMHNIKELPDEKEDVFVVESGEKLDLGTHDFDLVDKHLSTLDDDQDNAGFSNQSKEKIVSLREGVLIVINVISITFLVFLLFRLPYEAKKVHNLQVEIQKNQSIQNTDVAGIELAKEKADKLKSLFLNDEGIVQFVSAIESLKQKNQSFVKVEFPSQEVTKDKTGNMTIPVIIELSGSWLEVGRGFSEIEALPYLFRAVSIDIRPNKVDQNKFDVKYGGVLYVSEQTPKTKNR
ncbi:MAG: hypothetical protein N2558_02910 [Patescibacteria group bacterium]|nr:hypothetical protein [Patescibacteria group bacterium]